MKLPFNVLSGRSAAPAEQTSSLQEQPYTTLEGRQICLSREAVFDAQKRNDDRLIAAFLHDDLFLKNYPAERNSLRRQLRDTRRQLANARRRYEQNRILLAEINP